LVSAHKLVNEISGQNKSQVEILEAAGGMARRFLKVHHDDTKIEFDVYHQVIAARLMRLFPPEFSTQILDALARTAKVMTRSESSYVADIFIDHGARAAVDGTNHFPPEALEKALRALAARQPSRVLIHHLARLVEHRHPGDAETLQLLQGALSPPPEPFALDERVENVYTTMARVLWRRNKDRIAREGLAGPSAKEVIRFLEQAESNAPNLHAYDVHLRVLEKCIANAPQPQRLDIFLNAEDLVERAHELPYVSLNDMSRIGELRTQIAAHVSPELGERLAKEMLDERRDGHGYAALAKLAALQRRPTAEIHRFLDLALGVGIYPNSALGLKVDLLMQEHPPNYGGILPYAEVLAQEEGSTLLSKDARNAAIILFIAGKYEQARGLFKVASSKRLFVEFRHVAHFWEEGPRRKAFTGVVDSVRAREGWVSAQELPGFGDNIYFVPGRQDTSIRRGLAVRYEIGFSARGPIAFDLRPSPLR
jgi:hypothetical protein